MLRNLSLVRRLVAPVLCFASLAYGQDFRGSIAGHIADPSGATIPGATVTATHAATNVASTATAGPEGRYTILYLASGEYSVTVQATGFKKLLRRGIEVRIGDQLALDLVLEVGDTQQTVSVVADASLLETESASAGQVIDRRRISELPLSDGNPFTLSRLAPGVVYTSPINNDRPFDNGGTSNVTANGAPGYNEFTLDGSPNTGAGTNYTGIVAYIPPADAVEEFKIETSNFDAQKGHSAGATVNVTMRSGTNDLHGTLYEFFRNEKLSANDFFLNRNGQPRNPLRYNRWGGSVGGPVWIPGVYNGRNRTFFFFAYEGLKDKFPRAGQFTVPTDEQRSGDLSALAREGIVVYDPLTASPAAGGRIQRTAFPGNVIPANRLSAIAKNHLAFYPRANQPGDRQGRSNYLAPNSQGDDFHSETYRFDEQLTDRQRLFARFSHNYRTAFQGNWSDVTNGIRATGQYLIRQNNGGNIDHVFTFSPTTVLNWRAGFSRFEELRPNASEGHYRPADLGFPSQTAAFFGDASYFPLFQIGAFSSLGAVIGPSVSHNIYSFQPTLTKIAGGGRHQLKFGYDFRVYRENWYNPGNAAGRYDFSTNFTRGPLDNAAPAAIGQDLTAFLLGQPTGGVLDRNASRANQTVYNALFVHNDWKVTSRLTLNLGVRYEYEGATTERFNRNVRGLDVSSPNPIEPAARAAYAANPIPEVPPADFRVRGGYLFTSKDQRAFWEADKNNFQPRLGLAWRLGDKNVLRAGWGIFTVPFSIDGAQQDGFSQSTNIVPSLDNGLTFRANLANPFPDGVTNPPGSSLGLATFIGRNLNFPPQGSRYVPVQRQNSQAQRWEISLQRVLPHNWLVEASYVGNRGYDLSIDTDILNSVPSRYLSTRPERDQAVIDRLTANVPNPFLNLAPGTTLNGSVVQRTQLLRAFPQFLDMRDQRNDGSSLYHSLQARFERRFSAGYSLLGAYTLSRLMERTSFLNQQDTEYENRLGSFDRKHRFVISGIWEMPFGRGRRWGANWRGLPNAIVGGWQVQGVYQRQSGAILNFGSDYIFTGDPSGVRLHSSDRTIERWFNTAGFETNAARQLQFHRRTSPTTFPNVRDDMTDNWDLSALKVFHITERIKFQFRAEFLNAFNHPQFNAPNTSPTNSSFGRVTSEIVLPKRIQFGGKILF